MSDILGSAHAADPRALFTFFHPSRVRWAEVDAQGIVFNPRYFEYADLGFTEYMRAIGFAYPASLAALGLDLFVVTTTANFRASARYDDELLLAVRSTRIGRTSLQLQVDIFRDETLLAEILLVYVCARSETQTKETLPPEFVDAVLAFERTAPKIT